MGYSNPDVYYNPEHFGLTILSSADISDSYEYDTIAVWRHEDGRLFVGRDTGCSCNSPFEYLTSLDDLTEVKGLPGIVAFARDEWSYDLENYKERTENEIADLISGLVLMNGLSL